MTLNGRGIKSLLKETLSETSILATNSVKNGMTKSLAIRLGLITGLTPRLTSGEVPVSTLERTIASGLVMGERLKFNRTAQTLAIASTSVNDTITGGTGATLVFIRYIDVNGDEMIQITTLDGQTKVTLGATAQCINFLFTIGTGSTGHNEGIIYIGEDSDTFTAGKPDNNIWNLMNNTANLSASIWTMIPKNKVNFPITTLLSSDSTSKNDGLVFRFYDHNANGLTFKVIVVRAIQHLSFEGHTTFFTAGNVFEATGQTATGTINASILCESHDADLNVYPNPLLF